MLQPHPFSHRNQDALTNGLAQLQLTMWVSVVCGATGGFFACACGLNDFGIVSTLAAALALSVAYGTSIMLISDYEGGRFAGDYRRTAMGLYNDNAKAATYIALLALVSQLYAITWAVYPRFGLLLPMISIAATTFFIAHIWAFYSRRPHTA